MRAFNILLSIVVSVVIGLVVLELGLRLIPAFAPKPTLNQFDKDTGWSKAPGRSIVRRVGSEKIHFDINENGLRDDPGVGPQKPAGATRVLMLGDSFVLGYTVERKDLFVDLLENWWKGEGRAVDVVNTGTEGWSTDQEVTWFLVNARAYEPDLVLIFPYENDIYWDGQTTYESGIPKPRFLPNGQLEEHELKEPRHKSFFESTALYGFLGFLRTELVPAKPAIRDEFKVLLNDPPPEMADWVARTEGALKQLKQSCTFIGARLVMCPLPSKSAIDPEERAFFDTWKFGLAGLAKNGWSPDRPVDLFLDLAKKLGIPAIDPRPALKAAFKPDHKLYFEKEVEWHFNANGNRVLATYLHDELDRLELLPAAKHPGALPEPEPEGGVPVFLYVFAALWAVLGTGFCLTYPKEPRLKSVLSVGGLLALVFTIMIGGGALVQKMSTALAPWIATTIAAAFVLGVLGFVAWKLGRRLATIAELLRSFTLRGHWYLMPLVVVLLTIGSLLVVAASSPLIAPFIYTLF